MDPVRYISNRSSGKMGYAIAEAAAELGARVTLVSGPTSLAVPQGVGFISVETTAQMYKAVTRQFATSDCVIMAAAPADFAPTSPARRKIKKADAALVLNLEPTVDILADLGSRKKKQVLVGFALETDNDIANARKKLRAKNLDMIVLNSPSDERSAFEYDTNRVTVIRPGHRPDPWPLMPKREVAVKLLEIIAGML
ncbi:MAG: phosphopantothenoylcysteine decarboxylase [Candidatus Zixiibacteriota bacterium]